MHNRKPGRMRKAKGKKCLLRNLNKNQGGGNLRDTRQLLSIRERVLRLRSHMIQMFVLIIATRVILKDITLRRHMDL